MTKNKIVIFRFAIFQMLIFSAQLSASGLFYVNEGVKKKLAEYGLNYEVGTWAPQEEISEKLFGPSGKENAEVVAKKYPGYKWATEFSNVHTTFPFEEPKIIIDGESYNGPEQYFQLMKSQGMLGHEQAKEAMATATPEEAFTIGRRWPMRPNWDQIKDDIMFEAVFKKFSANKELKELLLSTGDAPLVQLKPNDTYWGTGSDGNGQNRLGKMLELIRSVLREVKSDK